MTRGVRLQSCLKCTISQYILNMNTFFLALLSVATFFLCIWCEKPFRTALCSICWLIPSQRFVYFTRQEADVVCCPVLASSTGGLAPGLFMLHNTTGYACPRQCCHATPMPCKQTCQYTDELSSVLRYHPARKHITLSTVFQHVMNKQLNRYCTITSWGFASVTEAML